MAIEDAICTRLLAQSAVTAITSTVRPYKASQADQMPFIVFQVEQEQMNANDLLYQGGLVDATVRIIAVASTIAGARELAEAIRGNNAGASPSGLAGYEGTVASVEIQGAELQTRECGYEPFADGSDAGYYHVDSIYLIHYTETP